MPIVLLVLFPALSFAAASLVENSRPTFCNIIASFAFHYLCLSTSIVAYRLSPLHPLYEFPGPRLARVSKLYGAWISATGKQHSILKRFHDEYGPIVRTGPNELSIADVDGVTKVLGINGLPKGEYYESRADPKSPHNLNSVSGEMHTNRRRVWNRAFNTESLKEYYDMIVRRAERLAERIGAIDGPVDLTAWLSYFQFDVMGDMSFSGGFEMLNAREDEDGLGRIISDYFRLVSVLVHVPWFLKTLARLPAMSEDIKKLHNFGAERAARRIKDGSLKKDLWYHLSDEAGLEKEKPALNDLIADGGLAIVAGGDTTSRAIQNIFYMLLSHPAHHDRLRKELDNAFPSGDGIFDVARYTELKFLDAVMNETLRLYPPIPTNGPRRVANGSKARTICGKFIPEGTEVYVPPYVLHRDPRYFSPSPDDFIPERWMNPETESTESILNTTAYIPFSYGPQNCVGKNLARNEVKMVTTMLLSRFNFKFADEFEKDGWEDGLGDYFIMQTERPILVTLTKRLG
ncbi:cytochrome P450 [Schizopora paradoxa]|uniref:Cytochrome P450 n=1 Tax=Schizopora paradoxa TaxID=27342 RepID=A0A0H2RVX1_9AGAM|nr:cytochrome P450 [Schizopora paradoxa]